MQEARTSESITLPSQKHGFALAGAGKPFKMLGKTTRQIGRATGISL